MTDEWGWPTGPTRHSIEVPLAGDGPLAERTNGPDGDPVPPNWRKVVGLASLGGVALGIVVSVVLIGFVWNEDDPADGIAGDPSTTLDGSDVATLITTPPTLDPLVLTPPTETAPPSRGTLDLPTTTIAPVPEDPQTSGTLPDYPRYAGIPDGGLDSFDLAAAVEALDQDVARRGETHFEVGGADNTLVITIIRDPISNRYGLTVVGFGGTREAVVDIDAGVTYVTEDAETWVQWANSELITDVSADQLGDYFEDLLFGPVRPDTLPAATIEPLTLVFFEGSDTIAREFAVELPGDVVPEWQFYVLSPIVTLPDELRPERLNYLVYVDDQGNLSQVIGTAEVGDATQLVIHRLERLDRPESILTPDLTQVIVRPTSSG